MWFVYTRMVTFEGETQISETMTKHGPVKSNCVFEKAKIIRFDLFSEWYVGNMSILYQTVENLEYDEWWWNGNHNNMATTAGIMCFNNNKSYQIKLQSVIKEF